MSGVAVASHPAAATATAARPRLRRAGLADAARLCALFDHVRPDEAEPEDAMEDWLEHGGALLLEDDDGRALAAVRWTEQGEGWCIDRLATLPEERRQGYGRWLMTKVEALAIRANVPTLTLRLDEPALLPYYGRMGYRAAADGSAKRPVELVKRVGGTWQYKGGA